MPASKPAPHLSSADAPIKSDLARVDAHVTTSQEYEEIPEITDEMVARTKFCVGGQAVPPPLHPSPENNKTAVSIRLSSAVLAHFRASGQDWETRIDDVLLDVVRRETAAAEK